MSGWELKFGFVRLVVNFILVQLVQHPVKSALLRTEWSVDWSIVPS